MTECREREASRAQCAESSEFDLDDLRHPMYAAPPEPFDLPLYAAWQEIVTAADKLLAARLEHDEIQTLLGPSQTPSTSRSRVYAARRRLQRARQRLENAIEPLRRLSVDEKRPWISGDDYLPDALNVLFRASEDAFDSRLPDQLKFALTEIAAAVPAVGQLVREPADQNEQDDKKHDNEKKAEKYLRPMTDHAWNCVSRLLRERKNDPKVKMTHVVRAYAEETSASAKSIMRTLNDNKDHWKKL